MRRWVKKSGPEEINSGSCFEIVGVYQKAGGAKHHRDTTPGSRYSNDSHAVQTGRAQDPRVIIGAILKGSRIKRLKLSGMLSGLLLDTLSTMLCAQSRL